MTGVAAVDETTPVLATGTNVAREATMMALRKPEKYLTPEQRAKETEKRCIRTKRMKSKANEV